MDSESRRYLVIGAGAVGGSLAVELARAGHEVVLVARGEHALRIRMHGLSVRRPTGIEILRAQVIESPEDADLRPSDVLLLTVKAQDVEATLSDWAWRPVVEAGSVVGVAADLPIVTFQNGLAAEHSALRRFARVYAATIAIAATYLSPGEIVSQSIPPAAGVIWLGLHPSGRDRCQAAISSDLNRAGFVCFSVDDSRTHKAAKLLGSVANVLDLFEGPDDLRETARIRLRGEAIQVLRAAGIPLPRDEGLDYRGVRLTILPVDGHVTGRLSTWQSRARGSSLEVDFLNGEVVLLGRQTNVETPLNQRAQRIANGDGSEFSLDALLGGHTSA